MKSSAIYKKEIFFKEYYKIFGKKEITKMKIIFKKLIMKISK